MHYFANIFFFYYFVRQFRNAVSLVERVERAPGFLCEVGVVSKLTMWDRGRG
jgi:hypothetical protein